jgi:hypothetical protein
MRVRAERIGGIWHGYVEGIPKSTNAGSAPKSRRERQRRLRIFFGTGSNLFHRDLVRDNPKVNEVGEVEDFSAASRRSRHSPRSTGSRPFLSAFR